MNKPDSKPKAGRGGAASSARAARQAKALRANLGKRRAQAAARLSGEAKGAQAEPPREGAAPAKAPESGQTKP
jgi:hypothetical protein